MFLGDDFLLGTQWAKTLYHEYAEKMQIIDYHCHLNIQEICENENFENITQAWLSGDHYKWRLMRACNISERLITGSGSDYDKFLAWCSVVPKLIGNPMYIWTHLELKRYFDIDLLICSDNANEIWEIANRKLKSENFRKRDIIERSNVSVLCTTDDPIDNLKYHKVLSEEEKRFKVFPTFRPDNAINVLADGFSDYIEKLSSAANMRVDSFGTLIIALRKRADFFEQVGCRLADHGLDEFRFINEQMYEEVYGEQEKQGKTEERDDKLTRILKLALSSDKNSLATTVSPIQADYFLSAALVELLKIYHEKGWAVQLHFHPLRNNNSRMLKELGSNTGFDAITDTAFAKSVAMLLDSVEVEDKLPKAILYSLNENDYASLITLAGCFQSGSISPDKTTISGKIQLGSAWWFFDTRTGMRRQLQMFADGSALANFVGMLTDSRSLLSYTRHEYFRRILCEFIGEMVERGETPPDEELLGEMVSNISYGNAKKYFGF